MLCLCEIYCRTCNSFIVSHDVHVGMVWYNSVTMDVGNVLVDIRLARWKDCVAGFAKIVQVLKKTGQHIVCFMQWMFFDDSMQLAP